MRGCGVRATALCVYNSLNTCRCDFLSQSTLCNDGPPDTVQQVCHHRPALTLALLTFLALDSTHLPERGLHRAQVHRLSSSLPAPHRRRHHRHTLEATRTRECTDAGATCEDHVDGILSHAVEVSGNIVNVRITGGKCVIHCDC